MTVYDVIQTLCEYPADAKVDLGDYDKMKPIKIITTEWEGGIPTEKIHYIPCAYAKVESEAANGSDRI